MPRIREHVLSIFLVRLKSLLRASSFCLCFVVNFVPRYVKKVTGDASQVVHVRGIRDPLLLGCAHRRIMHRIYKRTTVWLVNLKRIKSVFRGLNLMSALSKLGLPEPGLRRGAGRSWGGMWDMGIVSGTLPSPRRCPARGRFITRRALGCGPVLPKSEVKQPIRT